MKKYVLLMICLLIVTGCSTSSEKLQTAKYSDDTLKIEIEHDGEMGVHYEKSNGLQGGSTNYEHVKGKIFKVSFTEDVNQSDDFYYLLETTEGLELISSKVGIDLIEKDDYTPDFILKRQK